MSKSGNVPPAPVLPLAPLEYDIQFQNNLVRLVNYFIEQVNNPGDVRCSSLVVANFNPDGNAFSAALPTPIAATAMVALSYYTIVTVGTTNFTLVGAADNNIGTTFKATGAATGTGRVITGSPHGTIWRDTAADNTLKIIP
jgi:hypothetical protein